MFSKRKAFQISISKFSSLPIASYESCESCWCPDVMMQGVFTVLCLCMESCWYKQQKLVCPQIDVWTETSPALEWWSTPEQRLDAGEFHSRYSVTLYKYYAHRMMKILICAKRRGRSRRKNIKNSIKHSVSLLKQIIDVIKENTILLLLHILFFKMKVTFNV